MDNKQLYQAILFSLIVLSILGCNKKQEDRLCLSFNKAPVTKIVGANTASVGQEIILTVSFICNNGCGQFSNFEESTSGNTTNITVNAKYEGCVCTQDLPVRETGYKFKRSQAGTYDLKFLQNENNYLNHTIIVQ